MRFAFALFGLVAAVGCGHQEDYAAHCTQCGPQQVCAVSAWACEDEKFDSATCIDLPQACAGTGACTSACMEAVHQSTSVPPLDDGCSADADGTLVAVFCD